MMEKCWEERCICYFQRLGVKRGAEILYKITILIIPIYTEKDEFWRIFLVFSNWEREENVASSFFKNRGNVK